MLTLSLQIFPCASVTDTSGKQFSNNVLLSPLVNLQGRYKGRKKPAEAGKPDKTAFAIFRLFISQPFYYYCDYLFFYFFIHFILFIFYLSLRQVANLSLNLPQEKKRKKKEKAGTEKRCKKPYRYTYI